MADDPSHAPADEPDAPQLRILAQYVKDLSFENPSAPQVLRGGQPAPNIDLGIDVQARRIEDSIFEVDLSIQAKAERDGLAVFIAELKYSGLFQFIAIPAEQTEPLLLVECPRLLFPFARRIVGDVTRDGGFPPLFVDPIDFAALYQNQREGQRANAEPAADGA